MDLRGKYLERGIGPLFHLLNGIVEVFWCRWLLLGGGNIVSQCFLELCNGVQVVRLSVKEVGSRNIGSQMDYASLGLFVG